MSDSEGEIEYDSADEVAAPDDEIDDDLIADDEDYESDEAADEDEDAEEIATDVEEEIQTEEPKPRAKRPIIAPDTSEPGTFLVTDRPGFGRAESENVEEIIVVPDDDRRCSHALSTFELTELISVRSAQISASGPTGAMIDIPPDLTNSRDIAIYELKMRRCPLKIQRCVGQDIISAGAGKAAKVRKFVEFWSPNEM